MGHLIAGKIFNVYCPVFSIGFGYKFIRIRRKKGETTFTMGVLPLGGYVQLYSGESKEELPEGVEVPFERSLQGIKRWKRVVIMFAGIFTNFILAYIIFFISASCFPQVVPTAYMDINQSVASTHLVCEDNTHAFNTNDQIEVFSIVYDKGTFREYDNEKDASNPNVLRLLNKGYVTTDTTEAKFVAVLSYYFDNGVNNTDITRNITLYKVADNASVTEYNYPLVENNSLISFPHSNGATFQIPFNYYSAKERDEVSKDNVGTITYERDAGDKLIPYKATLKLVSTDTGWNEVGISFHKYTFWYGAQSFQVAGDYWVRSTSLISDALFSLFAGKNWDQVGGPLAIFAQTTSILESNPFYLYLQVWGIISVNLAIFNFLPFPGLDGWQMLTELIEGVVNGVRRIKFEKERRKKKVVFEESDTNIYSNQVTISNDSTLSIGSNEKEVYKKWKIPAKVKGIVSYVGLGLLFVLAVIIFIFDFIRMV
ncbi:MAG: site-2 protease family protein [Bacilli bacterium]|nr:site-2 protease family protein [Bacilli bacterium]